MDILDTFRNKTIRFPKEGLPSRKISERMRSIKNFLNFHRNPYNLGTSWSLPSSISVACIKSLISFNINNIGTWSDISNLSGLKLLEQEVVHALADLYEGRQSDLSGYLTSGSTEGNLFNIWMARNFLQYAFPNNKICIIKTVLSHYSINKAANILSLPVFDAPLDLSTYTLSPKVIESFIHALRKRGYSNFIFVLTYGYTSTGGVDNILEIEKALFTKKIKKDNYYFLADAAHAGLILPFLEEKKTITFSRSSLNSICVDFHKMGLSPYPCGAVIYRKKYMKYIENKIPYLHVSDSTILGSRPGYIAASAWANIFSKGRRGYIDESERCLELKNILVKVLRQSGEVVITDKRVNILGVEFTSLPNKRLPEFMEKKYGLKAFSVELNSNPDPIKKTLYQMYIMPHHSLKVVQNFLRDFHRIL